MRSSDVVRVRTNCAYLSDLPLTLNIIFACPTMKYPQVKFGGGQAMATFRAIMRRDVNLALKSFWGANALHFACSNPDANGALIKIMLAQPAIAAQLNQGMWPTTLKWKAVFRLAKIAVRFGAKNPLLVNLASSLGQTALHCAARWGNYEACVALVEAGADLQAKDSNGLTPLQLIGGSDEDPAASMMVIILGGRPLDRDKKQISRFSSTREEGGSNGVISLVQPAGFLSKTRGHWTEGGKKGGRWGLVRKVVLSPPKASARRLESTTATMTGSDLVKDLLVTKRS